MTEMMKMTGITERSAVLGIAGICLAGVIGLRHLQPKPEPEKPNYARIYANLQSDGEVRHYVQRDGTHLYVAEKWFECDGQTKKRRISYITDRDNNGFPERELVITGCGSGWIRKFSNNPSINEYSGMPEFSPINTEGFQTK